MIHSSLCLRGPGEDKKATDDPDFPFKTTLPIALMSVPQHTYGFGVGSPYDWLTECDGFRLSCW